MRAWVATRRARAIVPAVFLGIVLVVAGCGGNAPTVKNGAGTGPPATASAGDGWREVASLDLEPVRENGGDNPRTFWTGALLLVPLQRRVLVLDPTAGSWRAGALLPDDARVDPTLAPPVWDGDELLLLRRPAEDAPREPGRLEPVHLWAYDPGADTWTRRADPSPGPAFHAAVWADDRLLAFDGSGTVAAYRPGDDAWEELAGPTGRIVPIGEAGKDAVWSGREVLTFGGSDVAPSAAFDPTTRSWRTLAPAPGALTSIVWTGDRALAVEVDGGIAAYDPTTDSWSAGTPGPFHDRSFGTDAVWAGDRLVLFGGRQWDYSPGSLPPVGALDVATYDPRRDRWADGPTLPGGTHSGYLGGAWTGREVLVWGGGVWSQPVTRDTGPQLVALAWAPTG